MPSQNPSSNYGTSKNTSNASSAQPAKGPGSQGGSGVSKNFAESYGLKMHNPSDYKEAQAIQQAFRDQDAKGGR